MSDLEDFFFARRLHLEPDDPKVRDQAVEERDQQLEEYLAALRDAIGSGGGLAALPVCFPMPGRVRVSTSSTIFPVLWASTLTMLRIDLVTAGTTTTTVNLRSAGGILATLSITSGQTEAESGLLAVAIPADTRIWAEVTAAGTNAVLLTVTALLEPAV